MVVTRMPNPPGAHRNQCVADQPPVSYLFVIVFLRQAAGTRPV